VEGLRPGTYAARVGATGAATTVRTGIRVEAPGPNREDIALTAGGTAVVIVRSADGAPCSDVDVDIQDTSVAGIEVASAKTDAAGRTGAFRLAAGTYAVSVGWQILGNVTVEEGETREVTVTRE
jgi:hypothetical protein